MKGHRDLVVVSAPRRWADVLMAGGAHAGSPHPGWGAALRVGKGGPLVTLELTAPGLRQLALEASRDTAPNGPVLFAAGPGRWEVLDVAGRSPHEIIEALVDRLRTPQHRGSS